MELADNVDELCRLCGGYAKYTCTHDLFDLIRCGNGCKHAYHEQCIKKIKPDYTNNESISCQKLGDIKCKRNSPKITIINYISKPFEVQLCEFQNGSLVEISPLNDTILNSHEFKAKTGIYKKKSARYKYKSVEYKGIIYSIDDHIKVNNMESMYIKSNKQIGRILGIYKDEEDEINNITFHVAWFWRQKELEIHLNTKLKQFNKKLPLKLDDNKNNHLYWQQTWTQYISNVPNGDDIDGQCEIKKVNVYYDMNEYKNTIFNCSKKEIKLSYFCGYNFFIDINKKSKKEINCGFIKFGKMENIQLKKYHLKLINKQKRKYTDWKKLDYYKQNKKRRKIEEKSIKNIKKQSFKLKIKHDKQLKQKFDTVNDPNIKNEISEEDIDEDMKKEIDTDKNNNEINWSATYGQWRMGCCNKQVIGACIECCNGRCIKWWHGKCLRKQYQYSKTEVIQAQKSDKWFCPDCKK